MNTRFFLFLTLICLADRCCFAQMYQSGAVTQALGGANTIVPSGEAVWGNPAMLTAIDYSQVAVHYGIIYGFTSLPLLNAAAVSRFKTNRIGLGFSRTGTSFFNTNQASFSVAHKVDRFAAGITAGMLRYSAGEYGSSTMLTIGAGATADISSSLLFSAMVSNLSFPLVSGTSAEKLPVTIASGILWKTTENVRLSVQAEKEINFQTLFRAGLEYNIAPSLFLRTGISTGTLRFHGGAGYRWKNFELNYAVVSHPVLPLSHFLSFCSFLNQK